MGEEKMTKRLALAAWMLTLAWVAFWFVARPPPWLVVGALGVIASIHVRAVKRPKATIAVVSVLAVASLLRPSPNRLGYGRLFFDQWYHHQALRALNHVPAFGADTTEVLEATSHVRGGDADGWFTTWTELGDRNDARARDLRDATGRGRALLRAHTYYLRAEFFLPADDARRPPIFARSKEAFYGGIDTLGIEYEKIAVPFGAHHLNAIYYPPPVAPRSTLIVFCGGSDTSIEELYFYLGAAARERGYPILTFEGPGQGSVTREQGLRMTPEWEKPTSAVLDTYLATHPRPSKIVLIGLSLGGYLAVRAAAFDPRIDGVVAYDVFYDGAAVAGRNVPAPAKALRAIGLDSLVNRLARVRARWDTASASAMTMGELMFGKQEPLQMVDTLSRYSLGEDVTGRVRQDVLLFAGEDDQFVPPDQPERLRRSLVSAKSVTMKVYDHASGGAEHSQLGASTLWQADLFEWMGEKFVP